MKLGKKMALMALSAVFALSALLPQAASAQNYVDPNDEAVNEFLNSLGLEIGYPDLLWDDENFINFINKQQELDANTDLLLDTLFNSFIGVFDFIELANQISDPRFDEFNLTDLELTELQDMRNSMIEEIESLKNEKNSFLEDLFGLGFDDGIFDDDGYDYDWGNEDYLYVYAWSDYYYDELPAPGTIVWLYSEVGNPEGADAPTIAWEQTDGPEVVWLNTDSDTTAAFIMPEYDSMEYDYLGFEASADNGVNSDYDYVSFYIGEDSNDWDVLPTPCASAEAACIFG